MSVNLDRWLRVELRHLFALEAVAEEGSFSSAATRLGYVQSAVSHQIAALESIVGHRLFERTRGTKPVSLTREGRLLYGHATTILARVRAAEADLAAAGDANTLVVGTYQTITARIVPQALRNMDSDVRIQLVEQATEVGLLEQLTAGTVDIVFAELPLPDGPFEHALLFEDRYVLVAPSTSEIAVSGAALSLRDLAELPLIGHSDERPRLEKHLDARDLQPAFVARSDYNATIQALVREGIGYAVVPRLSVDEADTEIAVLSLDPSDAIEPRLIALVWNSDRVLERPIDAFVRAAEAACAELGLDAPQPSAR
ncbi:MAG: LysR family transcriptional regulator [Gaiellaceae bacterium]